ncbi:UdgX family uracil-DNA binding protein [Chenggangzhangella methanolivorans]|uniref:Type-4 uracil-DNA glycosylase n=1 Tax=Chenggangzhangella methanolivorans TaxID=1437009 RepID=A0A9E6UK07_9HYPH|nr:UdgX family uracil-DNA binding protein [Chenggangzhangella methanolivorans]
MSGRRIVLAEPDDVAGWRRAARGLLAEGAPPFTVDWRVGEDDRDLFGTDDAPSPQVAGAPAPSVPRSFLELAETGLLHSDPGRFDLFYRLLTRVAADRRLMEDAADPDLTRARALVKAVRRDKHKMTAFVRFREISGEDGAPQFVAWFEPEHHIVAATAPFFMRRFSAMRWSILTPRRSAHWNGTRLEIAEGANRADAPEGDALEALWRTYYASIFNPARLKVSAMRAEMPKKYWRNLPEAPLIGPLIAQAQRRSDEMVAAPAAEPKKGQRLMSPPPAAPERDPTPLSALREMVEGCRACPLWGPATQSVFGEGPEGAQVVVVGEQPGDKEDIAGRPFVGPAGALFDRAAEAAGVEREKLYVTNAVKHFKFEPRGKFRLHKSPAPGEIAACRGWLERELGAIRPRLVVAMGASAARAVIGRAVKVGDARGAIMEREGAPDVLVTVHPSYLLRLPDEARKQEEFDRFVADLRLALPFLQAA